MNGDFYSSLDWTIIAAVAGAIVFVSLVILLGFLITQNDRRTNFQLGDNMRAERAVVVEWGQNGANEGYIRSGGELWRAVSKETLAPGDRVTVTRKDGLLLEVGKA